MQNGDGLDAGFQPVGVALGIGQQDQVGGAATEELAEHAVVAGEVLANRAKGLLEPLAAPLVEVLDERVELCAGVVDVLDLRGEFDVLLLELDFFVDRIEVDVTELAEAVAQRADFLPRGVAIQRLALRGLRRRDPGGIPLAEVKLQVRKRLLLQRFLFDLDLASGDLGGVEIHFEP